MMNNLEFPETEDYKVIVGYSEGLSRTLYQIINKTTDVVEFEHPTFPVVYTHVKQLQYAMDHLVEDDEEGIEDEVPPDNVTPFKPH